MDPAETRQRLLAQRRALNSAQVAEASALVAARILALAEYRQATVVGTYYGIRGEIDLSALAGQEGPELAFPVTTPEEPLRFIIPNGPLVDGTFGTKEPVTGQEVDPLDMDLVLLPLVGADQQGNRIGHGAGFYDRTFANRQAGKPPFLVGVAHSFQVVDALTSQPWDVPLDLIITDTGLAGPGMNHLEPPIGKD
ncbi:MAG: 5-formyltetrahydrofolate cyclo-ligase [Acidimicrobiales bacterium]|nr:5-formyltetrahydrofolate cyclo-ligase [Acidimicrobiales bacterium]